MSQLRFDVISIGTLARNRLWNETADRRTAHATTTLIRSGRKTLLVDPGLPTPALAARLSERTACSADELDLVFFTSLHPAHLAGAEVSGNARLLAAEAELDWARSHLQSLLQQLPEPDQQRQAVERVREIIRRIEPSPDTLLPGVDLFPLHGFTPGTAGLLLAQPTLTALVTGAAVPSLDHFLAQQVLPECHDVAAAREAMAEVYEIADIVIPGYDNLFVNPRSRGM